MLMGCRRFERDAGLGCWEVGMMCEDLLRSPADVLSGMGLGPSGTEMCCW
jgi:hypothetical protein